MFCRNPEAGAATDGDVGSDVAAISVAEAKVNATCLVLRLEPSGALLVVTPVPTVTVHSALAGSVADAAVRVTVAAAPPEFVDVPVNVVE